MPKKFREVRQILKRRGWKRIRQAGSHETWINPEGTRTVTIAGKDSDTMQAGTLASVRRATGMDDLR